jgi:flagellin-like hook-associated protein FlgL
MNQLDLLATDSGYKGINFLAASNTLDVEFGSSDGDSITLTSFDGSAASLLAKADGTKVAQNSWATNANVNTDIAALTAATDTLKTETSRLSSGLSIINTRQDWVKAMVNTITEGADKLTLADMNEEGANMLMLQTRQTLGTTALSLSAQAAQSVLRLFA